MDNRGWRPTHESAFGNHVDCLDHLLLQGTSSNRLFCELGILLSNLNISSWCSFSTWNRETVFIYHLME